MKLKISFRKRNLATILFIILMSIVCETKFSIHVVSIKIIFAAVALIGVYIILKKRQYGNYDTSTYKMMILPAVPYLIAFLYTIVVYDIDNVYNLSIIPQAFTSTIYAFAQLMFAATIMIIYKDDAINIVYCYIVGSYLIAIVSTLCTNSFSDIVDNYNSIYNLLERNDIGTAVVPMIIFYGFKMFSEKKALYKRRIVILAVILFLCGKKSAFVSIAAAIIMLLITKTNFKAKVRLFFLIGFATLVGLFLYVVIIRTGILSYLITDSTTSASGRLLVWDYFSDQYSLYPTYIGKGFQYVHIYMKSYIADNGNATSLISMFGYLHNSILQIYIELGFFGFWIWYLFYLVIYPQMIRKRYGNDVFYMCIVLMISTVWMYMTDNTLTYPVYQSTLYVVLFSYKRYIDSLRWNDVSIGSGSGVQCRKVS